MKKNRLIATCILLMVCLVSMLVGCGGSDTLNVKGTATINLTLDKEYSDITVSCSEADITIVDSTHYKLSFASRQPVEVIVTSGGYESKYLRYSTIQLEKEINETISMEERKYKIFMELGNVDTLEDLSCYNGETKLDFVIINDTKLVVETVSPLDSIKLVNDGYKDMTINLESSYYVNRTIELGDIELIREDSSKIILILPIDGTDFDYDVVNVSDSKRVGSLSYYNNGQEMFAKLVLQKADNYLVVNRKNEFHKILIQKTDFDSNPIVMLNSKDLGDSNYKEYTFINKESISVVLFKGRFYYTSGDYCSFEEDDRLFFDFDNKKYSHTITYGEIQSKTIDLSIKEIVEKNEKKARIYFKYENGNLIDNITISANSNNYTTDSGIMEVDVDSRYLSVSKVDGYKLSEDHFNYDALYYYANADMDINVTLAKIHKVNIKIVDSKGVILNTETHSLINGQNIYINRDGYENLNTYFYTSLYDYNSEDQKYSKTFVLLKKVSITIDTTNFYTYLSGNDNYQYYFNCNGVNVSSTYYKKETSISLTEDMIGKLIELKLYIYEQETSKNVRYFIKFSITQEEFENPGMKQVVLKNESNDF